MQENIQKDLETTLAQYVAMPTTPDNIPACTKAMNAIAADFASSGMLVHVAASAHPWLIATTTPQAMRQKHVKVLLVAHFDVVAPHNKTHFTLHTTKDTLFGRGVFDMKFAAACYKELVNNYAQANNLNTYDIGILLTTDEEKGGQDGARDFLNQGWRCDLAIIPDSGWNWTIEERAKGLTYLYLQVNGRSTHSSRPWDGDNPIHRLAPALTEISQHFKNDNPQGVTVSIVSLEGKNGTQINITQTPDWVKAGISVRAFTTNEITKALDYIKGVAAAHNADVTLTLNDPPVHLLRNHPLVTSFIHIAREVHGEPIKFSDAMGASDARYFAQYNIPTVLMYPEGGGYHGPDEWIRRQDLYKYYNLLHTFIQKVAIRP
jgi:acetylornithine deacetylase/succinyl-diaminopimelate desuccinylase-like protein